MGLTCVVGWVFSFLAVKVFIDYAFGLFIWLPFVMGSISTFLFGYNNDTNRRSCYLVSLYTLLAFCVGLLTFAFEGIICIIMAMPIGLFFNWLGYLIGYQIVKNKIVNAPILLPVILILSVPSLMGFEYINKSDSFRLHPITTTIEIKASPETVWENVIKFPQLKAPGEFIFKTGIAYPINATISGTGVGAIRSCNFSTGKFIEPIVIWNKPDLLRFKVDNQPETMKEISPYNIHPNHLHGFFVSQQGQFKLTRLKNGNTLLEGTTWYYNKIQPVIYWEIWSDYIVHKIHRRVLEHIKVQSELITER